MRSTGPGRDSPGSAATLGAKRGRGRRTHARRAMRGSKGVRREGGRGSRVAGTRSAGAGDDAGGRRRRALRSRARRPRSRACRQGRSRARRRRDGRSRTGSRDGSCAAVSACGRARAAKRRSPRARAGWARCGALARGGDGGRHPRARPCASRRTRRTWASRQPLARRAQRSRATRLPSRREARREARRAVRRRARTRRSRSACGNSRLEASTAAGRHVSGMRKLLRDSL